MNTVFLDFEKPAEELAAKISALRTGNHAVISVANEIQALEAKLEDYLRDLYGKLTPWQTVQVARHCQRPQFSDIVAGLCDDFVPLSGDRVYADDNALIGGVARFRGRSCMLLGMQKGRNTQERLRHNFGMARPEGYRKAVRLMRLADNFGLPILSFVDTAGAYPGVEAEARGQAEAIANSIRTCLTVTVPVIATVVGEGGSGGAVAIAVADQVLMLENAVYSVISPEGCASILWHEAKHAETASQQMRLTARDALRLEVIDAVISEPVGGAHRHPAQSITRIGDAVERALNNLMIIEGTVRRHQKQQRYLKMAEARL